MLELLNQLDGFQPNHDIKVGYLAVLSLYACLILTAMCGQLLLKVVM